MKTPITYFGGKQRMVRHILPRIPPHGLYGEPFCGGAAVFFAKEPAQVEVLNDTNQQLINFYEVVQQNYTELEREIKKSLHARTLHLDAQVIYNHPHLFTPVQRAWAVWVLSAMSFSSIFNAQFGYDRKSNTTTKKVLGKKQQFSEIFAQRLENVQLECTDALRIIQSRDSSSAFFYCDPPYIGTDCRHYNGYTQEDFNALLELLSTIKGKFLLSSYPNIHLTECVKKNGWYQKKIPASVSVANTKKHSKKKTEVLTANYPI